MEKKYDYSGEAKLHKGIILKRIRALKPFADVKENDLGGWVEGNHLNLAHNGDAWIYDNAMVYGQALISGNAKISKNARVYDDAVVTQNATVSDEARVYGKAVIADNAKVFDKAWIKGCAKILEFAQAGGDAVIDEDVIIKGSTVLIKATIKPS